MTATTGKISTLRVAGALPLVLSLCLPGVARAAGVRLDQGASAARLEAAFIMNFVKFTEWSTPDDMSLVVCVIGDERVGAAVIDALRTMPDGSRVLVRQLADQPSTPDCHVAFIGESQMRRARSIVDALRGRPILTVSDSAGFIQAGGMVELFVEDGRMRFAVNLDAVEQAHVRLSSHVLGLAKIVHGAHAQ
jgi:YfiR/HmsC-like